MIIFLLEEFREKLVYYNSILKNFANYVNKALQKDLSMLKFFCMKIMII